MYSKQNFSFVDFKLLDWKCIGIFFWSLWVILSGITLWSLWVILSVSPFDLYEWYCQYHPLISMSDIVSITLWSQWVILSVSPFDLYEWYCQYQQTHSDTEKYQSVWRHNMMFNTDKKNNVSFEGLLYHSSSYRTRSDTSDSVCLIFKTAVILYHFLPSRMNGTKRPCFN